MSSPVPAPETSGPTVAAAAEDPKPSEDKQKLVFAVGERCLARWRDNRRFMATVTKDLGDGNIIIYMAYYNNLAELNDQN